MRITLEISDTVAHELEAKWGNLEQKMLELLVIEAYRSVLIGNGQVKRLLKLSTSLEVDAFLKQAGVELHYDEADLEADRLTMEQLSQEGKLKV